MSDKEIDTELLKRIAVQDKAAMKTLYERHAESLHHFIKTWLADPHDAADITHEVMLIVWRTADQFKGNASVKSWIFSIARFKAIDRNRKGHKIYYIDEQIEIEDESANPQELTIENQNAAKLHICIEKLSEAHRRVIHLAFFEELAYSEIALIEDCPIGTIKTRILHAKKLLLRCVEKD